MNNHVLDPSDVLRGVGCFNGTRCQALHLVLQRAGSTMHCTWNVSGMKQKCFLHSDKILWIMPPFPPHKGNFVYNWLFAGSHTVLKHTTGTSCSRSSRGSNRHIAGASGLQKTNGRRHKWRLNLLLEAMCLAMPCFFLCKNCPLWTCVLFFQNLEGPCPSNIGMRQFLHDFTNTFCLLHFKLCRHPKN